MKCQIKNAIEWIIAYAIAGAVLLLVASPYLWIVYDSMLKPLFG